MGIVSKVRWPSALMVALLLTGCSGGDDPSSTTSPAGPESSASASSEPAAPSETAAESSESTAAASEEAVLLPEDVCTSIPDAAMVASTVGLEGDPQTESSSSDFMGMAACRVIDERATVFVDFEVYVADGDTSAEESFLGFVGSHSDGAVPVDGLEGASVYTFITPAEQAELSAAMAWIVEGGQVRAVEVHRQIVGAQGEDPALDEETRDIAGTLLRSWVEAS